MALAFVANKPTATGETTAPVVAVIVCRFPSAGLDTVHASSVVAPIRYASVIVDPGDPDDEIALRSPYRAC